MTETRARRIQAECRRKVEELTPNPAPRKWPPKPIEDPRRLPGAWLYVYKRSANTHPEAILVRDDGTAHILLGAMRGAFDCMPLGLPKSSELFLGSTDHGRYQMFDNGVVVWEAAADVGFPVRLSRDRRDLEGRKTSGLVAFFDIRGFTAWSERHKGSEVQGVVGLLEREIQAAFGRAWVKKLFLKGTGDGTMIVAENGWRGRYARGSKLERSNRAQFILACCRTVEGVRGELHKELAVGCAVDEGTMSQVYVLGRHDYLGPAVNTASKLQALAWNEVCLSPRLYAKLLDEGLKLPSVFSMASRAVRVPSAELVKRWGNQARSSRSRRR